MDFFTSDTHYHHRRIPEYCSGSRGQFLLGPGQEPDIAGMNRALVQAWNEVVGDDDTVYHLGDFQMRMKTEDPRDILKQLRGRRKVLVLGNHDLIWGRAAPGQPKAPDIKATTAFWLAAGWDEVHEALIYHDSLGVGVVLAHEPRPCQDTDEYGIRLCGHVHDSWGRVRSNGVPIINVGVDVSPGLRPMTLQQLLHRDPGPYLELDEVADTSH